ncbi:hypothetical protein FAES_3972 [Fibrella aestuarina BUZ 2]|uniref:DUF4236 domain-containing protein n=1 Tax=Fibrella aestuarina BUZ 2 TaxID=1166018 RepID=I0KCX0_9BACT|nr:DUF4236 domain-containing protein [Fibrella aestuarina]CCH01973.1 hypothetical protein FAES_3972 [Fibrella aestuarina BUZ 2]
MAWSYRKRIKLIPGVHLNLSKSGISTSIGVRGASITVGKSGTFLNTSLPVLGLHNRQRLSGPEPPSDPTSSPSDRILPLNQSRGNIFSSDVQEITSQNMQGVKEVLLLAHQQRKELNSDLLKTKASLGGSKVKLVISYLLIYGLIKRSIPEQIKSDIESQKEAIAQLQQAVEDSYVAFEIDFDQELKERYQKLVDSFIQLTGCAKIWDVTGAHHQDRKTTRSSASRLVEKREVRFSLKSLPEVKLGFDALCFQNANGADLYIYPSFVIMYSSKTNFAVIGLDELSLSQSYVRFVERDAIPRDTKIIDKTWAKVNKNGSPDKRFKGNHQIPVVRYGELILNTTTGLNEQYQLSNYEFTEAFGNAFRDYQAAIRGTKQR